MVNITESCTDGFVGLTVFVMDRSAASGTLSVLESWLLFGLGSYSFSSVLFAVFVILPVFTIWQVWLGNL